MKPRQWLSPFALNRMLSFQILLDYSEDIQGEILFVLYKLFLLNVSQDGDYPPSLFGHFSKLLHLALEVLMKAQSDVVRLNCIGMPVLLTLLVLSAS